MTSTPNNSRMMSLSNGNTMAPSSLARSQTPPALPPSDRSNKGALIVTVLSAYDLPSNDTPTCVSLKVGNAVTRTGPPAARHKDRNSFRFTNNQVLQVNAALSTLYNATAVLVVEYADSSQNLQATLIPKKSTHIHETTWLILNLESRNSTTTTSTIDDDPTLRLQVRLEGPYRTEWAALVSVCNAWFHTVDRVEGVATSTLSKLPSVNTKYILIPTVPLVTAAVVLSPVVVGILVVGMPIFLPALVVAGGILTCLGVVAITLAASTQTGRCKIEAMCAPMYHTLLSTPSGQRLMYETGPRPTPVSLARAILPTDLMGKLFCSLIVDGIGSASYLLPVVGEGLDFVWAPIQTVIIMAMYDHVAPNLKYVSFMEEILPLTDVVPSATIGWLTEFGPQLMMTNPKLNTNTNGGASSGNNERQVTSSSNVMNGVSTPVLS